MLSSHHDCKMSSLKTEHSPVVSRILLTAKSDFMRFGFKSISMDDLAERCGVSKKTLYENFSSKETLINATLALHFDDHVKQLEQVRNSSENAVDELLGQFDIVSNDLQSLKAGVLYELEKYYHNSWKIFEEFRASKVTKYCLQNLERGKREGLYRNNINNRVILYLYLHNIDAVMHEERGVLVEIPIYLRFKETLSYHLHGILNAKGWDYLRTQQNELIDETVL